MRQVSLCHSVNFIKNKPYLDITTLFHAVQHVVHVGLTHVSIWQRFLFKDWSWRAFRLEVQFVEIPRLVEFSLGSSFCLLLCLGLDLTIGLDSCLGG